MKTRGSNGRYIKTEWSQEDVSLLTELYPNTLTADIAKKLGKGIYVVRNKAHNLGLIKSKEFRSMTGKKASNNPKTIATRFSKGHVSENKGKKQTEYMSAEAIEKTKSTRFQNGIIPHNTKEIGYERINDEGYIYIKTELRERGKLKHRVVWEQHNGKIPKGFNIQFKDGNRQNCNIDNLYIISRSEQLKTENSMYAKYPKEIQLAIKAKGALNRQINQLKKESYE